MIEKRRKVQYSKIHYGNVHTRWIWNAVAGSEEDALKPEKPASLFMVTQLC